MKTAEQFVNEECAVYNAEALIAAVKARDAAVIERCAQEAESCDCRDKRHTAELIRALAACPVAKPCEAVTETDRRAHDPRYAASPAPHPAAVPPACRCGHLSNEHAGPQLDCGHELDGDFCGCAHFLAASPVAQQLSENTGHVAGQGKPSGGTARDAAGSESPSPVRREPGEPCPACYDPLIHGPTGLVLGSICRVCDGSKERPSRISGAAAPQLSVPAEPRAPGPGVAAGGCKTPLCDGSGDPTGCTAHHCFSKRPAPAPGVPPEPTCKRCGGSGKIDTGQETRDDAPIFADCYLCKGTGHPRC